MNTEKVELTTPDQSFNQPTLEVPRDGRGRIRWAVLKQDPAQIALVIETEVRSVIDKGVQLKHSSLIAAGFSNLSSKIVLYYPESYRGLRQALDLPLGRKPRHYWAKHEAVEIIQQEARTIYQQEGVISAGVLVRNNRSDLVNAIRMHYPGGLKQLKGDLGINPGAKAKGYWTMENIRQEAEEFYRQNGGLSSILLQQAGRIDLETAIRRHAGGLEVFKKEIGLETQRKPRGYWNVETILAEAVEFYSKFGGLTTDTLIQHGRRDLLGVVVNKYPGGMRQLQKDCGIETRRKEDGYWTEERIREEALVFYHQYSGLTSTLLVKNGRTDLVHAVNDHYPGKWRQLKTDLGMELTTKPAGYWTIEKIEQEAREFYLTHGKLSHLILNRNQKGALQVAISHKYPGRLTALKIKLGIEVGEPKQPILSDEANEQLRRLVEAN